MKTKKKYIYLKFIKLLKIEYSIILKVEDQIIDLIKNNEIEKIKEQLKSLKKELNEINLKIFVKTSVLIENVRRQLIGWKKALGAGESFK